MSVRSVVPRVCGKVDHTCRVPPPTRSGHSEPTGCIRLVYLRCVPSNLFNPQIRKRQTTTWPRCQESSRSSSPRPEDSVLRHSRPPLLKLVSSIRVWGSPPQPGTRTSCEFGVSAAYRTSGVATTTCDPTRAITLIKPRGTARAAATAPPIGDVAADGNALCVCWSKTRAGLARQFESSLNLARAALLSTRGDRRRSASTEGSRYAYVC
jgi:hypothetical protein